MSCIKSRLFGLVFISILLISLGSEISIGERENSNSPIETKISDDSFPTLELNQIYNHKFSLAQKQLEKPKFYFYAEINQSGLYKVDLDMPNDVYYVTVTVQTLPVKTGFQAFTTPRIVTSCFFNLRYSHETSKLLFIPQLIFQKPLLFTFEVQFSSNPSSDDQYSILISKPNYSIKKSNSIVRTYPCDDNSEDNFLEYFVLDTSSLGVTEAGYYNLETVITLGNVTKVGGTFWENYYYTNIQLKHLDNKLWNFEIDWDHSAFKESIINSAKSFNKIVFLEPNVEYFFYSLIKCHLYSFIESLNVDYTFTAKLLPRMELKPNSVITIPAKQYTLVEVEIPLEDSLRITSSRVDNFAIEIMERNKGFLFNNFTDYDWVSVDSSRTYYDHIKSKFRYLHLIRRPYNEGLLDYSSLNNYKTSEEPYKSIISGGMVFNYDQESRWGRELTYEKALTTKILNIPLTSQETFFCVFYAKESFKLDSTIDLLKNFPKNNTTIDLQENNPLRIYNQDVSAEEFYNVEINKKLNLTGTQYSEEDDGILYFHNRNELETKVLMHFPGKTFLNTNYEDYLQQYAFQEGKGTIIVAANYSVYSNVRVDWENSYVYYFLYPKDCANKIITAEIDYKLVKKSIPEIDDKLEIIINHSQPVLLYKFPVEMGGIYTFIIERGIFSSVIKTYFLDLEWKNPFIGINSFSTQIGTTVTLSGSKTTSAFLIIIGEGYLIVNLNKQENENLIAENTFSFEFLIALTSMFMIVNVVRKNRKRLKQRRLIYDD